MSWEPLSREDLVAEIEAALAERDDEVRAVWGQIRIQPEKWRCSPWGDEGGGFWAVAIDGDEVLWFNDIEDGFNRSPFTERGTIGAYGCEQRDFSSVLEAIAQANSERARSMLHVGDLPDELIGPGTIERRQTTYWDLQDGSGTRWRVHFEDKVEATFASAEYDGAELVTQHPLLVQYDEPMRSLYVSGRPHDPRTLAERFDRVIRDGSAGWRGLVHYAGRVNDVERLLRVGVGLLMNAPESVCVAGAALLEDAGLGASVLGSLSAQRGQRALVLGRSYVIAGGFAFARR